MGLESTYICIDNSEYMRNGDFVPTRMLAQQDAVKIIVQSKLRSNPESNVGLMTMASLDMLVTLTTDCGKILAKLHSVGIKGEYRLLSGIMIAHLALKQRQGKNHRARIVAFVGTPVDANENELIQMAKKLKKEKVSVDIISFGEDEANAYLLTKFTETLNGKDGDGSHLVTIPPGPHLCDALVSSPLFGRSEDGSGSGVSVASGSGFEFGVDPNEDPELALALRVSMEEQRVRQEVDNSAAEGAAQKDTAAVSESGATSNEDAMLQRALSMFMDTDEPSDGPSKGLESMSEEEQIMYAMKMSMAESDEDKADSEVTPMETDEVGQKKSEDSSGVMDDPGFLQNVLESLPGVDDQAEGAEKSKDKNAMEQKPSSPQKKKKDGKK